MVTMNRNSSFRYRVYTGLMVFAVVVILGTSVQAMRSTSQLQASVNLVSHTLRVVEQVNAFWGVLGDSDSNGLRYLLTGEEYFRQQYRINVDELDRSLAALALLVADSPSQAARVSALRDLHRLRAQMGATTLQLKADALAGDGGAARAVTDRVNGGRGHDLVADMRKQIKAMVLEERQLLDGRSQMQGQMIRQTWATLLMANGLALVAGLVGFWATRSMQRQAQDAFRAEIQAEQARRASRDKSAFLASMSHEIRTPMNAIFGFTSLLSEVVKDPLQADYVASINKSSKALLSLINDVLDLSKMEAGKLELSHEPTELHEIVDQALTMFRHTAEGKGIYLRAEYDGRADQPLMVDPARVRQVLINLVSNAIKYTEQGGVVVRVSCTPSERQGYCDLELEVIDSGTGIGHHQMAVIFDPFEQGDSPDGKKREGTGLGLSISRRLATLMGGSLEAESELGEGSRFTMALPARAAPASAVSQRAKAPAVVDFDRLGKLDILVVDDVAWNRELARAYLGASQHAVREACDGVEAVEQVLRQCPDVVLMDLRMPRMTGEQALDSIRSHLRGRALLVIAVTASSLAGEDGRVNSRFDGYLRKPYTKAELFEALAAHFSAAPPPVPAPAAGADIDAASPPPASAPRNPDVEAIARLRELKARVLPRLLVNLRMREASAVAAEMATLAHRLDWPVLAAHAAALDQAVQLFDVPGVKRLLESCPAPEQAP
jgi:signal transduction histidine kinase/CheY-like chemotaxis protein